MGELALIAKQTLLFPVDCDTHKFFNLLPYSVRLTFLMPQLCFCETQKKCPHMVHFNVHTKLIMLTTYSQRPIWLLLRGWGSIALLLRGWASIPLLCMWGKTNWRLTCRESNILSSNITKNY